MNLGKETTAVARPTRDQLEAALADLPGTDAVELAQALGCTEEDVYAALAEHPDLIEPYEED